MTTPINEEEVRSLLDEGTLTEEQATLLRDWLDEDEDGRADLYSEVSGLLAQKSSSPTNTSLGTNLGLNGFSQAELTVLLPLLTDKGRDVYSDWQAAKTTSRKARIAESLLPALQEARKKAQLQKRQRVLKDAWDTCTLNLANLSDQEINLLRGILPREDTEDFLQMAILAQARLGATYQGLSTFYALRPNTFLFGLFRYRTGGEILEALQRGVSDPLSVPPQRGFHRFLWHLRGWGNVK
jgi:hypothetical protein